MQMIEAEQRLERGEQVAKAKIGCQREVDAGQLMEAGLLVRLVAVPVEEYSAGKDQRRGVLVWEET